MGKANGMEGGFSQTQPPTPSPLCGFSQITKDAVCLKGWIAACRGFLAVVSHYFSTAYLLKGKPNYICADNLQLFFFCSPANGIWKMS